MAKSRDFFDDEPLSHNNEPRLSHSLENEPSASPLGASSAGKKRGKRKSKKGPWYKHHEVVKGVVAGIVVLVLLFVILVWQFGLFSGPSQPKQTAAVQPPATTTQTPAATPPEPTMPENVQPGQLNQPPIEQPGTTENQPAEEKPAEPEIPPLPENVAKWKKDDYFRARREKNPKLLEAVAYLGKSFPGKDTVAEGLTDLLKPLPPEKPAETPSNPNPPSAPGVAQPPNPKAAPTNPELTPMNPELAPPPPSEFNPPHNGVQPYNHSPGSMSGLVEAVIAALGENGSDTAKKTIEGVLAGTFETDDDKVAVEAALKALLAHPGKENDALMLQALTKPDALRPTDRQGPWTPKDLNAKAFELAKISASSGLRKAMAAALLEHHVRLDPKDPMHEFLLSPDPLNCEAQLVLYRKADLTKETKTTLEDQFLDYGAFAMARLLDIPEKLNGNPRGGMGVPQVGHEQEGGLIGGFDVPGLDPDDEKSAKNGKKTNPKLDLAQRIANGLWSKQFLALLEPKLRPSELDTLEKRPKLLLLAGTIPQDSTRSALSRLFRKHWDQGPKALETAGLDEKVITDPGLLAVIKMLPRRDHKTTTRGARPSGGGSKLIEDARKKQETEQEWWDFSYKMVGSWCKRFHAAAQAKAKAAEENDSVAEAPLKLPEGFVLGRNARVVSSYHLSWPDAVLPEIAHLNPGLLEVYYIRVEEMNTPRKATAFYSRKADLRSADARTVDKTTWLDNVRIGSDKGRRRSLDVLITPPENYVQADKPKDETDTDLVIEILVVEIKDPNR